MALPSYRAMAYGPTQGEYTRATNYGPLGKLQQGDIAVSPNLLDQFPLGSSVDVVDPKTGEVLRSNMRVADTSWINADKPTQNSFELWNDKDLGHASLVPAGSSTASSSTAVSGMPVVQSPTPAPSYLGNPYIDASSTGNSQLDRTNQLLAAMRLSGGGAGGQKTVANAITQGLQMRKAIQALQMANAFGMAPRAQLVSLPTSTA